MAKLPSRLPAALALAGSVLGLVFAATSTLDYAQHLDRGVHDLHCSIVPGAPPTDDAASCRAALYSPYSAILKTALWGGVPISLFALGAFAFFAAYALMLLVRGGSASQLVRRFFAATSVTPLLVSIVMAVIAATQLGSFCKTCVGIYVSSILLAAGGLLALLDARESPAGTGGWVRFAAAGLSALSAATALPAVTYATTAPSQDAHLRGCGGLTIAPEKKHGLLAVPGSSPKKSAVFFEDPLCPTCKAFHSRLAAEGALERLDAQLVLLPLDSECNWMLSDPLHPGACLVSRALLCAEDPNAALRFAFEEQEELAAAGKAGEKALRQLLVGRFGAGLGACLDSPKTKQRLNAHLHYAAENNVPLSTPQMYLGTERLCDADTDIGLSYTLKVLAPEILR